MYIHLYTFIVTELILICFYRFIAKYVICPGCKYPELIRSVEGKKGLKSICKSCGRTNQHDDSHKAGKVIIKDLIEKGGQG